MARTAAALGKARRCDIESKAARIKAALPGEYLSRAVITTTYAAPTIHSAVAVLSTSNTEITAFAGAG